MIPTRRDFSRSDENRVVALYFYIEKNGIQREFNSVIIVKCVCLRLKFAEKLQNRYIKCTVFALLRLLAFEKNCIYKMLERLIAKCTLALWIFFTHEIVKLA